MFFRILLSMTFVCLFFSLSSGADLGSRLDILEETLKHQQKTIEDQQRTIEQLKQELSAMQRQSPAKAEQTWTRADSQEKAAGTEAGSKPGGLFGGSVMTNPYISLALNTYLYSSSINHRELENRGIPGYSILGLEQKKGFNISEGELFLFAPVDPYFNLYANIPFNDEGAELEEAYFVTTALPEGFQLKGGKFKSGFSRSNTQHPHAWDFVDAPLVYKGFMGGEGIIEKGLQLTYLPTLPLYTLLGVEVLQGENEVLFDQTGSAGPSAFAAYGKTSFDFGDSTIFLGPYILTGRTKTDTVADDTFFRGNSTIYGFEAVYKWRPSRTRSLIVQGEYLLRNQAGSLSDNGSENTSRLKRSQDGFYIQSLYQIGRWRVGARYDRLDLFKETYQLAGTDQTFRNPWRATGAIEFNPSEFARLRLQYNHDRSGGDGKTNREIFLQLILGIGAHGAHHF